MKWVMIFLTILLNAYAIDKQVPAEIEGYWSVSAASAEEYNNDQVFNIPTKFSIIKRKDHRYDVTVVYGPDTLQFHDVEIQKGANTSFRVYRKEKKYTLFLLDSLPNDEILGTHGYNVLETGKKRKLSRMGKNGIRYQRIGEKQF